MTTSKHTAYGPSFAALGSELNSVVNNANTALGAAWQNTTDRHLLVDLKVVVAAQGVARTAGAILSIFMVTSTDGGSTYDDANETTAELVGVMSLDAATTARTRTIRDVSVPPGYVKFFARNATTQTLAASGSSVTGFPHSVETV